MPIGETENSTQRAQKLAEPAETAEIRNEGPRREAAMQIALNDEEKQTLVEILNETLPNLREEVYKTENYDYREELKRREAVVKDLLARLGTST